MRSWLVSLCVIADTTNAFALEQSVHESISQTTCTEIGLGHSFCDRVGEAAYNVDAEEWEDPLAHAQMTPDSANREEGACSTVRAVLVRERALASDVRVFLSNLTSSPDEASATLVADQLGRALHTLQDECAHHGVPNPQHAWWSRQDTCTGSTASPDVQPEAIACARRHTRAVLIAFRDRARALNVSVATLDNVSYGATHWPARDGVCDFLRSSESWNGVDQRWDDDVVGPWIRDQLISTIQGNDNPIADACGQRLRLAPPATQVDTSGGQPWCTKIKLYCVGTADAPDSEPPWETDAASETTGGCSTSGSNGSLLVLALVLVFSGRSRGSRRPGRP